MKRVLLVVLSLLSFSSAFDYRVSDWRFFSSQKVINGMAETDTSYWVATDGGLVEISKVDYSRKYHYKYNSLLRGNQVSAVYRDRNGTMWTAAQFYYSIAGTALQAVTAFRGVNSFVLLTPVFAGDYAGRFEHICESSEGQIWLSSKKKLYKIENDSVRFDHDFGVDVKCMVYDGAGRMYVAGNGKLSYLQNGTWTIMPEFSGTIYWIDRSPDNKIIVTSSSGAYRIEGQTSSRIFQESKGMFATDAYGVIWCSGTPLKTYQNGQFFTWDVNAKKVFRDGQNRIWVVTTGDSLLRRENNGWTHVVVDNSDLPSKNILSLCVDHTGRLYAGTDKGMAYLENEKWTPCTPTDTSSNLRVEMLCKDRNNRMWAAMDKRLLKLDDSGNWIDENVEGLNLGGSNIVINGLHTSNDEMWLHINGTIYKRNYQGGEWNTVVNSRVSPIQDSQGRIWLGEHCYHVNDTFPATVHCDLDVVYEHDDGKIWGSGIYSSYLEYHDGTDWQLSECSALSVRTFTRHSPEAFWVTDGYNACAKLISKDGILIDSIDYNFTAITSSISCMARDSSGYVWIGSNDGLLRFDPVAATAITVKNHKRPDHKNSITVKNNRVLFPSGGNQTVWFTVSNLQGRTVSQKTIKQSGRRTGALSLSDVLGERLPSGVYLLSIKGEGIHQRFKIVSSAGGAVRPVSNAF